MATIGVGGILGGALLSAIRFVQVLILCDLVTKIWPFGGSFVVSVLVIIDGFIAHFVLFHLLSQKKLIQCLQLIVFGLVYLGWLFQISGGFILSCCLYL